MEGKSYINWPLCSAKCFCEYLTASRERSPEERVEAAPWNSESLSGFNNLLSFPQATEFKRLLAVILSCWDVASCSVFSSQVVIAWKEKLIKKITCHKLMHDSSLESSLMRAILQRKNSFGESICRERTQIPVECLLHLHFSTIETREIYSMIFIITIAFTLHVVKFFYYFLVMRF